MKYQNEVDLWKALHGKQIDLYAYKAAGLNPLLAGTGPANSSVSNSFTSGGSIMSAAGRTSKYYGKDSDLAALDFTAGIVGKILGAAVGGMFKF